MSSQHNTADKHNQAMVNVTPAVPPDFPAWMQPRPRRLPWGVTLAVLLALAVGWPLLTREGVPAVTYGTHAAFMAADFAEALREGVLVPLWSPHVMSGYGAPIPQFSASGASYAMALVEVLFTDDTAEAFRIVMVLGLAGAALAMYGLLDGWQTRWPMVGATAYALSPFVGLTAPRLLADPALVLAHALTPTFLWAYTRACQTGGRGWVVGCGGVWGALVLMSPSSAAMAWGLGLGFTVLALRGSAGALPKLLGAGVMGLGISAPFWLPALALDSAVTWLASPQPAAFRVSAWEFLAPVRVASGTPQFTLGWVLPLLVGLAWLGRWRGAAAWPLLTVGTVGVLVAWVGCVVSPAPVWLSMGTLAAVLAGAGGLRWLHDSLKPERRRWGYISAALSIVALSLSVFPSAGGAVTVEFSASAQLRYEQRTRTPAVLPSGRAIPSALPALAPANRLLLNDYDTPAFNRIPLNAGARMSVLEQRSHRLVWQVGTTQPVTLTVLVAAYPAWQAALDGQALPTARTADGLLSVRVPPVANGTLVVWHGWVPEHALAWLTVMLTALGMAVYLRTR